MLTSIRKVQKEVLIVVTFIICIAFAYLYSRYDAGLAQTAGPGEAANVWGRSYRGAEALKIANQFSLAMSELGFKPPFSLTPIGSFAQQLHFMGKPEFNQDRTNFVVNLLILRGAARRLGVEAGPEEVQDALEEIEIFQDPATGKFSEARVDQFVTERLGSRSMGNAELRDLIGDYVAYDKIKNLVTSGIQPTSWEVEREYRQRYEELSVYEIFLKRDDAAGAPAVTEEEIKGYYEENRETLQTPEKRKIGYFAFPLPARTEGEAEDQWKAKRIEEAKAFNKVYKALGEALEGGATLENALKMVQGQKAVEAGPFAQSDPPDALKGEEALVSRVFEVSPSVHDLGAAETEKAIYLFWIKETLPPATRPLEEVKDEIRSRLEAQKKDQTVNERAEKARATLIEELKKGGRTFPEVARAAGLTAKRLKPFNRTQTPEGSDFASTVASMVTEMQPGQLSEVRVLGDGALLVFVAQATLPKRDSEPEDRKRIAEMMEDQAQNLAFTAWFDEQREKASPVLPTVKLEDGEVQTLSIERFGRQ